MPDFGRWTSNGGDPSLNEINRTDRFLDALATAQPVYSTDPSEAELAQLLEGWRDEVRNAPLTATVTPRDAVLALDRAAATRRRTRTSLAVVGSAAAAVLCIGGFGAVVAGSGPGDSLYGLRTMLFGEQQDTRDDAVVLAAQTQMAEVQQLIDDGQWQAAQDKLETLTTTVATVNDTVRKEELVTQWQELTVKVEAQDPAATLPPNAPPPTFPEVVVIPSDGATSSETTVPPGTSEPTSTSETSAPTSPTTPSASAPTTPSTSPSGRPSPSPSPSTTAAPGAPLPTSVPGTPPPTVSATPQPTSAPNSPTALPTPTAQPTPSATPRPTPTADTPLPTPSTSVVEQQEDEVPTAAPTSQQSTVQAPAPRTAATTVTVPDAVEEPS
ncbi:hypothetical protein AU190_05310 [Mycolicibacterium acapulense]|uniref:Anti-sigma-D factor RsdA sigma factor binding region domain-containing protein n=1 Tax=Mycobacterium lehmannii TaxID=2048550 RepID=A0A101ADV9_9MYCO|nr:anti-sigma-D factor RsdA [Mycobacterium lehmannii]KUI02912.1 hypothetical protein AU189_21145 [Mycolicibacterium acapulense]KUI09082.1 hypothetical protein AU190_05310 [Mycolicibacterium acapulense]KUI09399.1 hypothetical protein AU191_05330 [Mycolicibacterium acapulense]KUI20695.1 hypothetical protein AU192_13775 [Mycobacterium lehmannii]